MIIMAYFEPHPCFPTAACLGFSDALQINSKTPSIFLLCFVKLKLSVLTCPAKIKAYTL